MGEGVGDPVTALLTQAVALHRQGDLAAAAALYHEVLDREPSQFDALNLLGAALASLGQADEALTWLDRAVATRPGAAGAHDHRGVALRQLGRKQDALAAHCRAVALQPDRPTAWINLGAVLRDLGRAEPAAAASMRALAIEPAAHDARFNLGCALADLGRHDEALAVFDSVPPQASCFAAARLERGTLLRRLRRLPEALACLDAGLAWPAATADQRAGLLAQRALVLLLLGHLDDAIDAFDAALAANPGSAALHQHRALARSGRGQLDAALRDQTDAMALDPQLPWLAGQWVHSKLKCADWQGLDQAFERLAEGVRLGRPLATPFQLTLSPLPPAALRLAAEQFMQHQVAGVVAAPLALPASAPRLRVAYVSADWHDHPMMDLLLPVFEQHDRSRIELFGVGLAPRPDDAVGRRAVAAVDQFVDVQALDDEAAAQVLRGLGLHLALDLSCFTQGARPGLFARRIAPLQLNYLGYPGSSGGRCHDVLVADAQVVPAGLRAHHAEALLMMPHCYFPGSPSGPLPAPPTRAAEGLPEDGFVFCCFNHTAKLTPTVFDIWMRLLTDLPGSVLWLREAFGSAAPRLRCEAAARGVDPQRLVFAPTTARAPYLARLGLADLFLDTLPYNAHTTGIDALRVGLPLLTVRGECFAGRVAASLLQAAGLPELVAHDLGDYASRARRIASDPIYRASLRARVAGCMASPLFDTRRYARDLARGYEALWRRHAAGLAPADLDLAALA